MQRFAKDEDGQIVVFTVIVMTMMLALAGFGLDIIQFETTRTKLQQTSDRATLAAASLTQASDSNAVVVDYFNKAGLGDSLKSVVTEKTLNSSVVSTEAQIVLTPTFMNLWDLENKLKLSANAKSRAEQRINNIEIVLVLDVSGSMSGTKLTNLKTAATEFVDTVLDQDAENRISMAIVPYNAQVNLPQYLQDVFVNRVDDHNITDANCFDLPPESFGQLGIPATANYPVAAYADSNDLSASSAKDLPGISYIPCIKATNNMVLAPTNDSTALKNHINGLSAKGNTSIHLGMKWGMSLLDPAGAPMVDAAVADGKTPASFGNRPFGYGDREAMKIVVLMTDGENVQHGYINDGFRTGTSNIWRADNDVYTVYHNVGTSKPYYLPATATVGSKTYYTGWYATPIGTNPVQQTWEQVWAKRSVPAVEKYFFDNPLVNMTLTQVQQMFRTFVAPAAKNSQLQQVCSAAHAEDVIVYGIAFEAPPPGQTAISNCASSPAHYFNAAGLEIRTAFRSIATNISQLKLTQ